MRPRALVFGIGALLSVSACGVLLDQSGDDSSPPAPPPTPDAAADDDPKDATGASDAPGPKDAGVDAPEASFGCANAPCERYVFVTSVGYPGGLGGIDGADAKCMSLAAASGDARIQSRAFIAYLATTVSVSPNGGARLGSSGPPFRGVDGTLIADTTSTFLNGPLKSGIKVNEKGIVAVGASVWTGMNLRGTASGTDCNGWTSTDPSVFGTVGNPALSMTAGWVNDGTPSACNEPRRLYCVEP
jgi:hypothetical protein